MSNLHDSEEDIDMIDVLIVALYLEWKTSKAYAPILPM